MKSEETIFLLSNDSNYYPKLKSSLEEVMKSYCNLITFYVSFSIENMNIKDKDIFFTGINVVNHVYKLLMLYTRNLEVTFYNTQQCIYYYVEYISQITDRDDNIFFNLSIKDAVIYVYTRSIFEIRKQYVKQNNDTDSETFKKLNIGTNNYIKLIKTISNFFFKMENTLDKDKLTEICILFLQNNNIFNDNMLDKCNITSYDDILTVLQNN